MRNESKPISFEGTGNVESATIRLSLVGAKKERRVTGLDLQSGVSNHLFGNNPAQ
jgi:hypothetical protein